MSLYYPQLRKEATLKIWDMHISRVREMRKDDIEVDEQGIRRWAERHYKKLSKQGAESWNGRQIRNAFQTALALAEYAVRQTSETLPTEDTRVSPPGKPKLEKTQFVKVAEASHQFDKYMVRVWGGKADADIARTFRERADETEKSEDQATERRKASKSTKTKKGKRAESSSESSHSSSSDSEASSKGSDMSEKGGANRGDDTGDSSSEDDRGKKRKDRGKKEGRKDKRKREKKR